MGDFSHRQGCAADAPALPDAGFAEPPAAYGPHAFWFWNHPDRIGDPAHAAGMARAMAAQGLNPGYAHARFWAPDTPFWQTGDWHASFAAAVEATAAAGAHLGWAMGDPCFPDKYILPDHPELRAGSLRWRRQEAADGAVLDLPPALFHAVARRDEQGSILSATLALAADGAWTAPAGRWTAWSFSLYHGVHPGGTAISVLDRRTTAHWLALEHDRYLATVGRHLGGAIDSIFFDHEGSYGYKLAWSDDLALTYREDTGDDIRRWMPLLLEEDAEGRWPRARLAWFQAVGRTYRSCLLEPLDAWCRARGVAATCHLWEERLAAQALQTGGYMAAQRAYAMPGTDALFLEVFDPRLFKETQSVCEFEGRPCMSEALGIAGWHLAPEQMKRAANAAVAWGVTRLVPHGVNAARDLAKTAYPPDFFDWNPYWRRFRAWSDFVRRASFVNDHGRLDASTLLLCPLDSVCALLGDGIFDPDRPHDSYLIQGRHDGDAHHAGAIAAIEESYTAAMRRLAEDRVEFLVADGHYLVRMAVVDGRLRLGPHSFSAIVLPPLAILPRACARRLADFAAAGGTVIALGDLPRASADEGLHDGELDALLARLRAAPGFRAAASLDAHRLPAAVDIEGGGFPLVASRRRIGDRLFLWLANNTGEERRCVLRIPAARGRAERWDCDHGTVMPLPSEDLADGGVRLRLTLAANDGCWLVLDPARPPLPPPAAAAPAEPGRVLAGPWRVRIDPSVQPDQAQHRLAAPAELLGDGVDRHLASWLDWGLRAFSGFVDYHLAFTLELPRGDEVLDLGRVLHLAEVEVNGVDAGCRLWAPYVLPVGALLRPGVNRLRIRVGNLVLNAVTQYPGYAWPWHGAPGDDQLDAGLFGPVVLRSPEASP